MTPCPINPSLLVLGSDQASLYLARAFLSPWGGGGTTSSPAIKKKKERDEDASTLPDLFRLLYHDALRCASRRLLVPPCRSIYYVACRCLCGLLHPKKKPYTRDAPATALHCRQWSNQILLSCGALLAVQDGLRFAVRVSGRFLRSAVYFSVSRNSVFHACTAILRLVHDF